MIEAACRLAQLEGMARLARWTHMFGFRGHFATHSRRYSTTLSALRCARVDHERHRDRRHPHQDDNIEAVGQDRDDDDTTLLVGEWRFAGVGRRRLGQVLSMTPTSHNSAELACPTRVLDVSSAPDEPLGAAAKAANSLVSAGGRGGT